MEKKRRPAILALIIACLLPLVSFSSGFAQSNGNNATAQRSASSLMARLSPEEKVGQLFLVTFDGREIGQDSQIYDLITNYHIGGVVLKRDNENFSGPENIINSTYGLISGLQNVEWQARDDLIDTAEGSAINDFIPLFIGMSQAGDSYPYDQILDGLSPIPSQMAIGATWNVDLAERAGVTQGRELSALGVNFFIGPSLDVLDITYNESGDDLGVRTFGGDPFWVGEMGKAYIKGLHEGSNNQMAVIAKNFPGRGSSDRLPEEEVATVRKSLEQLKLIELAPFFQVTNTASADPDILTDGLLLSHIRYQGFQGNIRATTKPVSFDQTAVDLLMNLSEFSGWRGNGGILVSEDLGSDAVRKFFNPGGQSFDGRQVARNAFLAGNDLLYMDQFVSNGDANRYETYKKTIEFFIQKYREDQAFAAKVDASVLRILTLKYETYPEFQIENVIPNEFRLSNVGSQTALAFDVASNAVSLISPEIDQLTSTLADVPLYSERVVIFTDEINASQCNTCQVEDIVAVDSLQKAILKLYGPNGSGQVSESQFISYSFTDLQDYIENPFNRVELETNLSRADWVIFVVEDNNSQRAGWDALQNLLSEKIEVIRNKKVVVFSMNAPYYFDATDISAFTAYYGLYSKLPSFVEVAARILFQEVNPVGSSPVSIPGVAYDLISATTPDANQIIELMVDDAVLNPEQNPEETASAETPSAEPVYNLGDNLPVRTGVIVDHNGHPVPDGTVVKFMLNQQGENVTIQQVEATTTNGIARTSIKLQSEGVHEIHVSSEPALNSQILVLNITPEEGTLISAITPTPAPTMVETTDLIENEEPQETAPVEQAEKETSPLLEWFLTSLLAWGSGLLFFFNSETYGKVKERAILSASITIGGLLTAMWFIVGLPGAKERVGIGGYANLMIVTLVGEIVIAFGVHLLLTNVFSDEGER
ncbi:MAG: beta-N-acetylhexosaminidase [Chloroflexota bacterium]|nr:beta-N-acetylhexosaminidase [Chloroflexota bacterium]